MSPALLSVVNVAFFAFHTALILFNVFGWIDRRTRPWNLALLLLTLFSWTVMGLWFGKGYCVCTDLHWRVRAAMGIHDQADSYLVLLVRKITGWDPPVVLVKRRGGGRLPGLPDRQRRAQRAGPAAGEGGFERGASMSLAAPCGA